MNELEFEEIITRLLANDPELTKVKLQGKNINLEQISRLSNALRENNTLKNLDLSDNRLNAEAASVLAEALKNNTTLEKLRLLNNNIRESGAQAFAEMLRTNTGLRALNLSSNCINAEGIYDLFEALRDNNSSLTRLDVQPNGQREEAQQISSLQYHIEQCCINNNNRNKIPGIALPDLRGVILERQLEALSQRIAQVQQELAEGNPFAVEGLRLLSGLKELISNSVSAQADAFQTLQDPFSLPLFQEVADEVIVALLTGSDAFEDADSDVRLARYQLIAHHARNHPEDAEYRFARVGIAQLQDGAQESRETRNISPEHLQQLTNTDEVLELNEEVLVHARMTVARNAFFQSAGEGKQSVGEEKQEASDRRQRCSIS